MKKVAVLFLFLMLFSLASAAEIRLSKETYSPGETLQAEIYGNFIDGISLENIYFYRERNLPLIYDILKLKDKYLLYALLPSTEGNYSIKIKERYETESGISNEISKNFEIRKSNFTSFSINPGFVVARSDFSWK